MNSKPIYLYVTPFFPSAESWRGSYGYDFVCALMRRGVDVRVFREGTGPDYVIDGVRVYRFKSYRLPSNIFPLAFAWLNCKSFLSAVKRAGISFNAIRVCHANTASYGVYSLAVKKINQGAISVLQHHDLQSFGLGCGVLRHSWLYNMLQFPLIRAIHERIDMHVFISEACRKSFLAAPDTRWTIYHDYKRQMRWLPYRPANIKASTILHNGVDRRIFMGHGKGKMNNGILTIGCIANFQVLKDHMTLLKAMVILQSRGKRVRLLCIGSGETLLQCKEFVLKNELDVEFFSEVSHGELPEFYRKIDLFVLPSYFEGLGCVYLEALSMNIPIIGCKGQGVEDIVDDEFLIKPKDDLGLADKIERIMTGNLKVVPKSELDIDVLVGEYLRKVLPRESLDSTKRDI